MAQEAFMPTQPSVSISISWLCNRDETFVDDTAERDWSVFCNEESFGFERLSVNTNFESNLRINL